jgi:hypothetical protein
MLERPVYPPVLVPKGAVTNREVRIISRKGSRVVDASYDASKVPEDIGHYLTGFADGEGSFNLSFRKRKDYSMPWKISLCFNVSQRERTILTFFERYLQCGSLRQRGDGVWYYEVNDFGSITEKVIPFFKRFRFLSEKKRRDFEKFVEIAGLIRGGSHLRKDGIREILRIRRSMNDGGAGRRKYSDDEILRDIDSGTSSETIRQAVAKP